MGVDDSFKKPGSVPFKWEIIPGVPKIQSQQQPTKQPPPQQEAPPSPPRKLRPPPTGLVYVPPPPPAARSRSFRYAPKTRSERWRFEWEPEILAGGCFPVPPLLRGRKGSSSKRRETPVELETLARWSVSSQKSLVSSSFRDSARDPASSPSSIYSSSYQSSPRPISDAEWAGFGLF